MDDRNYGRGYRPNNPLNRPERPPQYPHHHYQPGMPAQNPNFYAGGRNIHNTKIYDDSGEMEHLERLASGSPTSIDYQPLYHAPMPSPTLYDPNASIVHSQEPLDTPVTIAVSTRERDGLMLKVSALNDKGETVYLSQYIRNRARGIPDIFSWISTAKKAKKELQETYQNKQALLAEYHGLLVEAEEEENDIATLAFIEMRMAKIDGQLRSLLPKPVERTERLSGFVSASEAEIIKWRAQRLRLSTSDYLRMLIFELTPNSPADQHLDLVAKLQFYNGIIKIGEEGWQDEHLKGRHLAHMYNNKGLYQSVKIF